MDHITKAERSALMSKIRGKDTAPEKRVRKLLWAEGYRYRLHRKELPGCPDLVFASINKIIFINGCFWHGHKCWRDKLPKTRTEFWQSKIQRNKKRDISNIRKLRRSGWTPLTVWECETKNPNTIKKLLRFLEKP